MRNARIFFFLSTGWIKNLEYKSFENSGKLRFETKYFVEFFGNERNAMCVLCFNGFTPTYNYDFTTVSTSLSLIQWMYRYTPAYRLKRAKAELLSRSVNILSISNGYPLEIILYSVPLKYKYTLCTLQRFQNSLWSWHALEELRQR